MAKYSSKWKSEKQRLREEAVAKIAAGQVARQAEEMPELWRLLARYRVNGWEVQGRDVYGNVVSDESSALVYWLLTAPGWAPVIVRGGLEELRRKSACLR